MTPRPPSTPDRVTQQSGQLGPRRRTTRPARPQPLSHRPAPPRAPYPRARDRHNHSIPVPA